MGMYPSPMLDSNGNASKFHHQKYNLSTFWWKSASWLENFPAIPDFLKLFF